MTPEKHCQLLFYGEILPGHETEAVRVRLTTLLKLPAEQADALFSGRKVVLHKSLSHDQAISYVARLEKMGIRAVLVETSASAITAREPGEAERIAVAVAPSSALPSTTLAPVPATGATVTAAAESAGAASCLNPVAAIGANTPPAAAGLTDAAALADTSASSLLCPEEMDCPKCGERQPHRTLCRACAVDMKRFVQARQEAEQAEREARIALAMDTSAGAGRGAAHARRHAMVSDEVAIWGLSFEGRLGRWPYFIGGLLMLAGLVFAALLLLKVQSLLLFVAVFVVALFFSVRLSVLRCHDINWSGWPVLILLLPYIGGLFGLVLTFMPGSKGDNNYGSPSRPPALPLALVALLLCGIALSLAVRQSSELIGLYAMQQGEIKAERATRGKSAPQENMQLAALDTQVEMFTTSSCGVCHQAKAYMRQRGISFTEKDVEQSEEYLRDFYARGGRGVPFIFVGRQSMLGFSPDQLERMLAAER